MRNTQWLRYGFATLTMVGLGLSSLVVACGDDDVSSTPDSGTGTSGGTSGTTSGGTSGTTSSGDPVVDSGPPPENAKLQLVNAATDLGTGTSGALRVCYGIGPSETAAIIAPLPPLPDTKSSDSQPFPGVFIGTGGPVQGTGTNLATLVVVPYVMSADRLAARGVTKPGPGNPGISCTELFTNSQAATDAGDASTTGGRMVEGLDYWKLPSIPAQTFLQNKSFLLVLTGCAGNSAMSTAKCGANFTPGTNTNGNLAITVHELDRATKPAADKMGAQFVHASAAGASFLTAQPGGAQTVIPGFVNNAAASASFKGLTAGASVAYNAKATPLTEVAGLNFDLATGDKFTANANVPPIAITLVNIAKFSFGAAATGAEYKNGASFTFVAVGDPEQPQTVTPPGGTPVFNTKTFHYLGLPNDPAVTKYAP